MLRTSITICLSSILWAQSLICAPTQSSPNPEIPVSGEEVWNIEGVDYRIEGTSLLIMGSGEGLFVVKALCDFIPDASHIVTAKAIAGYAIEHGYQKKVVLATWNGKVVKPSDSIGVSLIKKSELGPLAGAYGYRYSFKIAEVVETQEEG